jgi:hypothetical protein
MPRGINGSVGNTGRQARVFDPAAITDTNRRLVMAFREQQIMENEAEKILRETRDEQKKIMARLSDNGLSAPRIREVLNIIQRAEKIRMMIDEGRALLHGW